MSVDAEGARRRVSRGVAQMETETPPNKRRALDPSGTQDVAYRSWAWAFVGQGASSATTLGLSVVAGRALGVGALGVVAIGLGAYFVALALHRALVTTPLIASSSALAQPKRAAATRTALTVTLTMGGASAGLLAVIGAVAGGPVGQGMLVFAPWLVPAFAQDLFRSSLFRDGRGRQATFTDIAWLGTFLICAPLATGIGEIWAVVAAWGVGSLVAALLGAAWIGIKPAPVSATKKWFLRTAFPFGRWLALQEGSFAIGFYGLVLILVPILGPRDLGGLRAAETVFAPMTLLAPAVALAGIPVVSRALARSHRSAINLASRISCACMLLVILYSGVMLTAGSHILTAVFGADFEPYGDLVLLMSLWQLTLAIGVGFTTLLRAAQHGKALLATGTAMLVTGLVATPVLAGLEGPQGAVAGYGAAAAVYGVCVVWLGVRVRRTAAPS